MRDPLVHEVLRSCREEIALAPHARVLVAVSGGADSSALAVLLRRLGPLGLPLALSLAHVDHAWRGPAEARADADAVRALAGRLGLPLTVLGPPPSPVPTEDAARRFRFEVLGDLALSLGATSLATGHHLGDQAETVWMRLRRGSGPAGLCGIPFVRPLGRGEVTVVRPLLGVEGPRLRRFLREAGVPWREDATNADPSRDRVRVRGELARWEARAPGVRARLAALAGRHRARRLRLEGVLRARLDGRVRFHPRAFALEVEREALAALTATELDLALRILGGRIEAEREGPFFTRRHLALVGRALGEDGAVDLPRGLRFEARGRRAFLRRPDRPPPSPPRLTRRDLPAAGIGSAAALAPRGPGEAVLDADRLGPEARIDLARPEDRFRPFGAPGGRPVPVLAWLRRQQVPEWLRRTALVVRGGAGVAWVPGHRIDGGHAVGPATREVALLALEGPRPA